MPPSTLQVYGYAYKLPIYSGVQYQGVSSTRKREDQLEAPYVTLPIYSGVQYQGVSSTRKREDQLEAPYFTARSLSLEVI